MSLVCGQCSRVNPAEASYCYYDGAALAGRAGGRINAGAAPFPSQFIFPNGLACRNFDQLASACQQHWLAAIDLLKQGYLGSFFGGIGRVDLAMAAQEAAQFPDIDRGLDQLLAKLPTQALQAPKLQAEPSRVNLGQIRVGDNRASELHLSNLGMRLLYGNVTSDCKWLTLGDAPGHPEKLFQFSGEAIIPVQVRGQHLRAGNKPLEGHLTIDSNGGTRTVTFLADVPITPYESAPFAGAVTPRQIAEKSKANPKEAVPSFESGAIAKWYAQNGWAYPVQGTTMPGMGGIQQFFEALGVAKAPKVEFSPKILDLHGAVGKTVEASVEVQTTERKVVYGWATCDQTWLEVGQSKLLGKSAVIPITIRVPDPCPPMLEATLNVIGNGNQKAAIPLKVKVAGGKTGVVLKPAEEVYDKLEIIEDDGFEAPPTVALPPAAFPASPAPYAAPPLAAAAPPLAPAREESPFAISDALEPPRPRTPFPSGSGSALSLAKPTSELSAPLRLALYLAPVGALFLAVLILLAHDIFFAKPSDFGAGVENIDPRPRVKIVFDEGRAGKDYTDSMTFAVHKIDPENKAPSVKLNWYENGFGNSTVLKIDDQDRTFGKAPDDGIWLRGFEKGRIVERKRHEKGKTRKFDMRGIIVTQTVTIVPSDPVEIKPGEYQRILNTCLVRYTIENQDSTKKPHRVGLRVFMDTCIGENDGVPFTIPGIDGIVTTAKEFRNPAPPVPDFVQVIEKPSVRDPGIVVHLGLNVGTFEAPDRFMLTQYNKEFVNKWEVPVVDFDKDSSVVLFWDPKELAFKDKRELGFTYGLGSIAGSEKLGITIGGATYQGGELTVVALVADRAAKTATLKVPPGLKLTGGNETQKVEPSRGDRPSPVTWRLRAENAGAHDLSVSLDSGPTQTRRVVISAASLFN